MQVRKVFDMYNFLLAKTCIKDFNQNFHCKNIVFCKNMDNDINRNCDDYSSQSITVTTMIVVVLYFFGKMCSVIDFVLFLI